VKNGLPPTAFESRLGRLRDFVAPSSRRTDGADLSLVDDWIDEVESLLFNLQHPAFLAELRRAPEAEQREVLQRLRAVMAKLRDVIYVDDCQRAFLNSTVGREAA
jgi:hypothetical protein